MWFMTIFNGLLMRKGLFKCNYGLFVKEYIKLKNLCGLPVPWKTEKKMEKFFWKLFVFEKK